MNGRVQDPRGNKREAAPPRVAIVVLNWNGRDDTLECLASLRSLDYPNFEILVVDNGSRDGSVPAISDRFPELEVIETGRNLGYAEGNNVGMRAVLERKSDYVLLLNNDTVVDRRMLSLLVTAAERCPEGGFFGPTIFYYADRARVWTAGVEWHEPEMEFRHVKHDVKQLADERGVVPTDYVCGCALLMRTDVLRRIGLLDPKFFSTFEETDLCYRGRRLAIRSYIVPEAEMWHKISVSFGGADSPLIDYFLTRNRLLWGERHLDRNGLRRLYKVTWWDLHRRLFRTGCAATTPFGRLRHLVRHARTAWKDPANKAAAWGIAHYLMRRFGAAPRHVLSLVALHR